MATVDTVHAHNYQHFESLQMSAKDFYRLLRDMINEYDYPDVECVPVTLKEAGLFSSKREYMRISRQRYHYYVCASPYGKSFFISWWLQEDANTTANVVKKLPLFGKAAAERLESKTYYELDTQMMFASSISTIIRMAVDKVKADKGYTKDIQTPSA